MPDAAAGEGSANSPAPGQAQSAPAQSALARSGQARSGQARSGLPPSALPGLLLLAAMGVLVTLGPMISPYAYDQQGLAPLGRPTAPSAAHWLGTDELGRDALTRLLAGGRISLAVGLAGALAATGLGTVVGALAGYFRGWVDELLMRLTDVMLSIPALPLVLVVSGLVRPSPPLLVLVIAALIWMAPARLARGQVISIAGRDFVAAAQALGAGRGRVILRHILPSALGPITVSATIAVSGAIMLESALSFLGFGVQPPVPTWGGLLNQASPWLISAPWLAIPPGLCIFVTVLAVNAAGDALRAASRGEV
jgi:peptide/nickel transport system permease protein